MKKKSFGHFGCFLLLAWPQKTRIQQGIAKYNVGDSTKGNQQMEQILNDFYTPLNWLTNADHKKNYAL